MKTSENEYTMEILASLAGKVIAKAKGISDIQGFDLLMNSKTGEMLFYFLYNLWNNGPDYIDGEYMYHNDFEKNQ